VSDAVRVDTVVFAADTDFAGLAREVLLGGGAVGSLRSDCFPLDWVFRAYEQVRGTSHADGLARGVAACLTAVEPEVRAQALIFFQSQPAAAGGERIVELVAGDRALFAGVPDPMSPGVDLEWPLLAALAARLSAAGERGLALARAEALRPGKALPLIGALLAIAPGWVLAHAEEIVRGTPAAGLPILSSLPDDHPDRDRLIRRIAPLCHGDAQFEAYLPRLVDEPATRQAILDAYRTAAPGG
jgi:hypothetical protein